MRDESSRGSERFFNLVKTVVVDIILDERKEEGECRLHLACHNNIQCRENVLTSWQGDRSARASFNENINVVNY